MLNYVFKEEGGRFATTKSAPNSPQLKDLKIEFSTRMVGERSIRGEVRAKALVDCIEVRMPE